MNQSYVESEHNVKEEFLCKRLSTGHANNELLQTIAWWLARWDELRWLVTDDGMDGDDNNSERRRRKGMVVMGAGIKRTLGLGLGVQ